MMNSRDNSATTTTVILGSGIIGLSTAYYLTESGNTDPKSIHLLDSSPELFRCASGLAGGFLAQDWFAPSVASLGALSYKLHAQLAETHNGRATWGYAHTTGISLSQDSEEAVGGSGEDWLESGTSRAQIIHDRPWETEQMGPGWLRRTKDATMEVISRQGTTAQIDPLRFCKWLLVRCLEKGVQLHYPARAISLSRDSEGLLDGIRISQSGTETEMPCTRLVIAAGAWSPRVFNTLFPTATTRIPISSLAGHSLLVRNPHFKPAEVDNQVCHAVFATDTLGFSPEWFARIGGELYLAGLNSTMIPLPDVATDVKASEKAMGQMKSCAKAMMVSVPGTEFEVLRETLVCFISSVL
ncbi:FAD dependent oxidoreductase-domain-containing protein [Phaeosphaeriaceae sp. PMI808]|nr:FAD dependent oxidoreductase-domain-containing protein [Phaeosphaeriaceae sp. PMI808]